MNIINKDLVDATKSSHTTQKQETRFVHLTNATKKTENQLAKDQSLNEIFTT